MTIIPPAEGDTFYGQSQAVPVGQMRAILLPRCAKCNAKHPWARRPIVREWECPDCAHPCAPPQSQIVKIRLPGILGTIADLCYGIGIALRRLAERLRT